MDAVVKKDRGPQLATIVGTFLALTWVFIFLRVYVKTRINKKWTSDDTLLIVSQIFFSAYCASSLSGIKYGTGRHLAHIPFLNIPNALYYWWLCELLFDFAMVFLRLSIAVLLLRICTRPLYRWIIHGTLGVVITYAIFLFFFILFQCKPVTYFWAEYEGQKGSCVSPSLVAATAIAQCVIGFVADWNLGILPIFLLWNLQMNRRTKISVAVLLSLGLLAGIASIIRVPFIRILRVTDDFLFATADVVIWSTIEPGLAIIAAACATLRPLFKTFYDLRTSREKGSPHGPTWPSSRAAMGYMRNRNGDGQETFHGAQRSVANVTTSTLLDKGEEIEMGTGKAGVQRVSIDRAGIKVEKTVQVSSLKVEDEESSLSGSDSPAHEPRTPWSAGV